MQDHQEPELTSAQYLTQLVRGFGLLAVTGFFLTCFAGPFALLAYQGFIWLRDGFWDRWPVSRALEKVSIYEPYIDWVGVQKIVTYVFGMPTALALPIFGALALSAGGAIMGVLERRA